MTLSLSCDSTQEGRQGKRGRENKTEHRSSPLEKAEKVAGGPRNWVKKKSGTRIEAVGGEKTQSRTHVKKAEGGKKREGKSSKIWVALGGRIQG